MGSSLSPSSPQRSCTRRYRRTSATAGSADFPAALPRSALRPTGALTNPGHLDMRKLIVYNIVSLDGFHTGPDNDVSVMVPMMGTVFDTYNAELLRAADVHLVGRVSFHLFEGFWPEVAERPDSDEWTPSQRELSEAGRTATTVVVSDTVRSDWPGVRVIRRADAHRQIA